MFPLQYTNLQNRLWTTVIHGLNLPTAVVTQSILSLVYPLTLLKFCTISSLRQFISSISDLPQNALYRKVRECAYCLSNAVVHWQLATWVLGVGLKHVVSHVVGVRHHCFCSAQLPFLCLSKLVVMSLDLTLPE